MLPSLQPIKAPTTTQPSAPPTMSGFISTVTATTSVSEDFDQSTIEDYITDVAQIYGVDASDITAETAYTTSGSLSMTIPTDVSISEVEESVAISIAESLNIHPQAVAVTVDAETGEVHFTVTTPSFDEAADIQFDLENAERTESIIGTIEDLLPSVSVEEFAVSEDIDVTIEFVVDADDAANDLTQAAFQSEQLLSGLDFDVTVESNLTFYLHFQINLRK